MIDMAALADFIAAVEAGGVNAAARARNQPKQTVSRRLMALEADLGVRLFDRSTRALRLTAEGAVLHVRATRILTDLDEARRALVDRAREPEGLLRISAPVLLGQTLLGAVAADFVRTYPKVRLEIVLADRRVDLIEEGFDAAIRVGALEDDSLVARVFAQAHNVIVASPHALADHGAVRRPDTLSQRPCILFGEKLTETLWELERGGDRARVRVLGQTCVSSMKLALDVAIAGGGFASVPAFLAREAIASGRLVRVLSKWRGPVADLRIVFPTRRLMSARLRAFIDLLAAAFPDRRLATP